MKGRTNVIDDESIVLNASTENKRLLQGSVLAGDFVEYNSVPTWIDLSGGADFKFAIGNYAIAAFGSLLSAFKNGQRVATYSDYGCDVVNKYNDRIIFYDTGTATVGVLSIENDAFTLIDSLKIDSSTDTACCIAAGDGKVCVTRRGTAVVLDIGNDGSLSNAVITSISINTTYEKFLNYSEGFYYSFTDSRPSGAYTYYSATLKTVEIIIDGQNVASLGNTITCYGADIYNNSTNYNGKVRQIYQKGKIIGVASTYYQYHSQYSGEEYHGQQGYIYFVNIATGAVATVTIADHGEAISCISDGKLLTSKCYKYYNGTGSNQWTYIANAIRLYSFNEETYTLTELAVKTFVEDTENAVKGNRAGCADDFVYVQLRQSGETHPGGIRVYEIAGGVMGDITDKNYVLPYINGDNPIGVAKESGAAGDTIPVYIPTPSV